MKTMHRPAAIVSGLCLLISPALASDAATTLVHEQCGAESS